MARLFLCALFAVVVYGAAGRAQAHAPVNALLVTGGCCHDYTGQSKETR